MKNDKKNAKAKAKESDTDSDSDTDMSMSIIDQKPISKKWKLENYLVSQLVLSDNKKTEEERAYLKTLHEGEETETSTLSGNLHEPMGYSISSKYQLNPYSNNWDLECCVSMAEILRPKKKAKTTDLSTITLGYLYSKRGIFKDRNHKRIKILFDTGCGAAFPSD